MWRVAARCIVLACGLSLAACLPNLPGILASTPVPSTQSVEVSPTSQATSTLTSSLTATPVPTYLANTSGTFTAIPTFTPTGNPGTAVTATGTAPTTEPTETATVLEPVSLDKLPPSTVYKRVRIENQSRSQMDISLHCTTVKGLQTVLEYENVKNISIQAPDGNYIYVVYAGGRQMTGSFSLLTVPSLIITVYKDRVAVH